MKHDNFVNSHTSLLFCEARTSKKEGANSEVKTSQNIATHANIKSQYHTRPKGGWEELNQEHAHFSGKC